MANVRIKDITTTASAPNDDDYLAIDGATAGTRKISAANLCGDALTTDIKDALLQIASKVAYIDDQGQTYYDDLYDALYPPAPPATLLSISAVYTQSGTVYNTDTLDSLRPDLVVTASYDDGTTQTVTTYTLSGTLEIGNSTVTVSYNGKTTTFTVLVSERMRYSYADGTLEKSLGGFTVVTGKPEEQAKFAYDIRTQKVNVRRAFHLNNGEYPLWSFTRSGSETFVELTEPYIYPIPIPTSATGVSVLVTPSTQFVQVELLTYTGAPSYESLSTQEWIAGQRSVSFEAGQYQYLTVMSKYDSSGTSYPTEPTDLVVEFQTA